MALYIVRIGCGDFRDVWPPPSYCIETALLRAEKYTSH